MHDENNIKDLVKEKYGKIARQTKRVSDCCSCGCSPDDLVGTIVKDDYEGVEGYVPEADLDLGCGLPTEFAGIKPGDAVVDLGSGAGNDVFIARAVVGETGSVIGIDMTQDMIDRANANNKKAGFANVEFRLGEIEALPVRDNSADVVVSNCVLNLVPDKTKAYSEIYRVLKPGAHFCISDITLQGELPQALRKSAELYVGCVAGASDQVEYLNIINKAGFSNVEVKTSKQISLAENVLKTYLSENEINAYKKSGAGIFSVTVTGDKT